MKNSNVFDEVVNFWGGTDLEVQNGTEKIEARIGECIIYSFISQVDDYMLGMQVGKQSFGGVHPRGDFGMLFNSLEEAINCATENYTKIDVKSALLLAEQIKAKQKAVRMQKESERIEKLSHLIDTFKDLQPSESESIIKDILKIARNSDFYLFFKRSYVNGVQTCFYDGLNLTVIEKGSIKVSSLPFVIFLRKFKLEIFNYYGGKSEIEYISNEEYARELQTVANSVKIAVNIGINLTTIAKNKIESTILGSVVKTQRKAEIKTFRNSLKKDSSYKGSKK